MGNAFELTGGIDFKKLVTDGHRCSDLRLPVRSPTVTSLVTVGHPKRKLNKVKEIKEEPFVIDDQKSKAKKAQEEIKKVCGFGMKMEIA